MTTYKGIVNSRFIVDYGRSYSTNPFVSSAINTVQEDSENYYIGGKFDQVVDDTVPCVNGAFLNTTTEPTSSSYQTAGRGGSPHIFINNESLFNGPVYCSFRFGNQLLVGGDFTTYNNIPVNRLALINIDTNELDSSFLNNIGSGFNGPVYVIHDDINDNYKTLYIGGSFTSFNNNSVNSIVAITGFGLQDIGSFKNIEFNTGNGFQHINTSSWECIVYTIYQRDNTLYVGGQFNKYRDKNRGNLVKIHKTTGNEIDPDGTNYSRILYDAGPNAVRKIAYGDDGLYILGKFTFFFTSNNQPKSLSGLHKISFNDASEIASPLNSKIGGTAYDLIYGPYSSAFIIGSFTMFDGKPRNNIVKVNINTGTEFDTAGQNFAIDYFGPTGSKDGYVLSNVYTNRVKSFVSSVIYDSLNSVLYLAGHFDKFKNSTSTVIRNNLIAINLDTGLEISSEDIGFSVKSGAGVQGSFGPTPDQVGYIHTLSNIINSENNSCLFIGGSFNFFSVTCKNFVVFDKKTGTINPLCRYIGFNNTVYDMSTLHQSPSTPTTQQMMVVGAFTEKIVPISVKNNIVKTPNIISYGSTTTLQFTESLGNAILDSIYIHENDKGLLPGKYKILKFNRSERTITIDALSNSLGLIDVYLYNTMNRVNTFLYSAVPYENTSDRYDKVFYDSQTQSIYIAGYITSYKQFYVNYPSVNIKTIIKMSIDGVLDTQFTGSDLLQNSDVYVTCINKIDNDIFYGTSRGQLYKLNSLTAAKATVNLSFGSSRINKIIDDNDNLYIAGTFGSFTKIGTGGSPNETYLRSGIVKLSKTTLNEVDSINTGFSRELTNINPNISDILIENDNLYIAFSAPINYLSSSEQRYGVLKINKNTANEVDQIGQGFSRLLPFDTNAYGYKNNIQKLLSFNNAILTISKLNSESEPYNSAKLFIYLNKTTGNQITSVNSNELVYDILLTQNTISENSLIGAVIGELSIINVGNSNVTFSVIQNSTKFGIDGNVLKLVGIIDYESNPIEYVTVRATDSSSNTYDKQFAINLLNSAPTSISLSNLAIAENATNQATVATISAADPGGGTFIFSFDTGSGSEDNSSFQISGNLLKLASGVSLNYELKNTYSIKIKATDPSGLSVSQGFTINVTNINESPSDLQLTSNSILENLPINTVIGTLSTTDIDENEIFTYSVLVGTTNFNISGNQLRSSVVFDYEISPTQVVTIRATDSGGLYVDKQFTINVLNVNEAPTSITISNSSILENNAIGDVIGTLSATDPENNSVTFSLDTVNDYASFSITGNQLKAATVFNRELKNLYTIRVIATDTNNNTFAQTLNISIGNTVEPPLNISLSSTQILENNLTDAIIGTLSAIDPEGGTISFSVVDGADKFNVVTVGGIWKLRASVSFDYATQVQHSVTVRATNANSEYADKTFSIEILEYIEPETVNLTNQQYTLADSGKAYVETIYDPTVVGFLINGAALVPGSVVINSNSGQKYLKLTGNMTDYYVIPLNAKPEWVWSTSGYAIWQII